MKPLEEKETALCLRISGTEWQHNWTFLLVFCIFYGKGNCYTGIYNEKHYICQFLFSGVTY